MRVLRRRWPVIVLSVAVASSAAWIATEATSEQAPLPSTARYVYGATVLLWDPAAETHGRSDPVTDPAALARLVEGQNVAAIAAPNMYHEGRLEQLLPRVEADVDPTTGFLAITGIGSDAVSAQTIANSFSQGLIVYLSKLKAAQNDLERQRLQLRIETLSESGAQPAEFEALHRRLRALEVERTTQVSLREFERQAPVPRPLGAGTATAATEHGLWVPESIGSRVLLASLFGLLLGILLALLLDRFDYAAPLDRTGRGGVRDARPG